MSLHEFLTQYAALAWLVLVPFCAALVIMIIPRHWHLAYRMVSAIASGFTLVLSALVAWDYLALVKAGKIPANFQDIWQYTFTPQVMSFFDGRITFHLATDGAGAAMCLLTALTIFTGVFASWTMKERAKEYYALLLLLVAGVFGVFVTVDLFFFFLFYEIAVLPMYLLIGIWGTGEKEYSAMKLTLMLLMGSALIFVGFLALFVAADKATLGGGSFNLLELAKVANIAFGPEFQRWVFLAFYVGFGVLAGIFPIHTWSPDGHASAPTATSMLHAGVLMKLGGFGLLRVALPLLPEGLADWRWLIVIIAAWNIVYGAFSALGQKDLKYVVAYSSVSHLGMVMLGLAAGTLTSINGAVFQMFAHGVMTALFFALVGLVYQKAHTRDIDAMGGLAKVAPGLAVAFMIGGLSSVGLPGTGGFIAEFLVFMGTFLANANFPGMMFVSAFACLGIVITSVYVLRLLKRVFFGVMHPKYAHMEDAKTTEWVALTMNSLVIVAVGLWPMPIIQLITSAVVPVLGIISK
jgi:NADH-quinone oxidoreductase subunit M